MQKSEIKDIIEQLDSHQLDLNINYVGKALSLILVVFNVQTIKCRFISNRALDILNRYNIRVEYQQIDDAYNNYYVGVDLEIENAVGITDDPNTALFMTKRRLYPNFSELNDDENAKSSLTGEDIDMFNERKYEQSHKKSSSDKENLCDTHWDGA